MRLALVTAVSFSLIVSAVPFVLAATDEPPAGVPLQMADVAKGKNPAISGLAKSLHVAYENDAAIFYSPSTDAGKSWGASSKVSGAIVSCTSPAIATSKDGTVHIVFQGKSSNEKASGVFYTRSADAGKTFSDPVDISNTPTESSEPQITIGGDDSIHVVWVDALPAPAGPDIYYTVSTDAGKSWSKREDLSNTPGGISFNPCVAVGSDARIHVAWSDTSSGDQQPDIFFVQKSENGWSKPADLSRDTGHSSHPRAACGEGGKAFIVWCDDSRKEKAADVLFVSERKPGQFGKPLSVSEKLGESRQPDFVAEPNGRMAFVWSGSRKGQQVPSIWARAGNGGALTNSRELHRLQGASVHPAITLLDKKAYIVWEESNSGSTIVRSCELDLSK